MSIIASTAQRELIPAGNYIARCYQLIEIGTVTDIVMGRTTTSKKVRIGWELPEELKVFNPEKGEQPLSIAVEYTLSTGKKATLRSILASWRGKDFTEEEAKGFDITKLIGAACMLNIIHKAGVSDPTKMYEKIAGITPLPKGVKAPKAINPPFVLSYDAWDKEMFLTLPEFIQNRMKDSAEFQKMLRPAETEIPHEPDQVEDDLPF
jgi:hypothetical protein